MCEMRLLLRVPSPLGTFGVEARMFVLLLPVRDLVERAPVVCSSTGGIFANHLGTFSVTMSCCGGEGSRLDLFAGEAELSGLPALSMSSSLGSSYFTAFFATLLTPLPVLGLRSTSSTSSG